MNVMIWKPPNPRPCGGTCTALSTMRACLGRIDTLDRQRGLSREMLVSCLLDLEGASWEFLGCQRVSRGGHICTACT